MKRHTIAIVGLAALVIAVTAVTVPTPTPTEQTQKIDDHTADTPANGEEG